jgi:hypothetical protein
MQRCRMLSAGARFNGTYIVGAKGSGKSTFATELAWHDYLRNIGEIIIDPIRVGLTDAFLWKFLRFQERGPDPGEAGGGVGSASSGYPLSLPTRSARPWLTLPVPTANRIQNKA